MAGVTVIRLHGQESLLASDALIRTGTRAASTNPVLGTRSRINRAEMQMMTLELMVVV